MARWIATAIALAVMVGGGIAAAESDDGPALDEPVTTTTTLVTTTTLGAPDALADDEPGEEPGDDPADGVERYWGPECGDGEPTNHGQYVASSDRGGESRNTAAHSPCGKPLQSADVPTTTAAPVEDDDEDDEEGDAGTSAPLGASNAGQGQGGGNGNAKGGAKHG